MTSNNKHGITRRIVWGESSKLQRFGFVNLTHSPHYHKLTGHAQAAGAPNHHITRMMAHATRLSTIPVRAMVSIPILPEAKTMALGGVAMGNIKAQLEARVTGTAK